MHVELRMYKRHDADLIMLKGQGVSIHKLLLAALDNYVKGVRVKYRIPAPELMDVNHVQTVRYHVNVQNPEAEKLLKHIRRGYRNQFCKMLLRDALDAEPVGIFLAKDFRVDNEASRLETASLLSPLQASDFRLGERRQRTVEESMPKAQEAPEAKKQETAKGAEKPKKAEAQTKEVKPEAIPENPVKQEVHDKPRMEDATPVRNEEPDTTAEIPQESTVDEWDLFGDFEEETEPEHTFVDNDSILSGFEQLMQ